MITRPSNKSVHPGAPDKAVPHRSSQQVAADAQESAIQQTLAENTTEAKVRRVAEKENMMAAANAAAKSSASRLPATAAIKASKAPIKKPEAVMEASRHCSECDEHLPFVSKSANKIFTLLVLLNR